MTPAAVHYTARLAAAETSRRMGTFTDERGAELAALYAGLTPEERATVPDGAGTMWVKSQRWATIDGMTSPVHIGGR